MQSPLLGNQHGSDHIFGLFHSDCADKCDLIANACDRKISWLDFFLNFDPKISN